VPLSSEVLHGDAASALVSEGRNAFALVLASIGLGDLVGLLLGLVSLAVAARADCPVVAVRSGVEYRDGRFGSVVGVEDGAGSGTAVQFAFREAHVRRCRLVAVHAWNAPPGARSRPPPPSGFALEARRRPPTQVLDDALRVQAERYPDASVSRQMIEGPTRQALLDAASGAELLVVGARRRRGHLGLQLGLINHAVLHHAPCPIVVVPQV
jgi:nucleotide-binding universal stress UspA family protein